MKDGLQNEGHGEDEGGELEELDNLEEEVSQIAKKVLDYRNTLPEQLKAMLSSVLVSQRPPAVSTLGNGSDPRPSTSELSQDMERPVELNNEGLSAAEDQENAQKLQLLKDKISSNASAMPKVLKRMKECISRIEKLESCDDFIRPVFKRKRTS